VVGTCSARECAGKTEMAAETKEEEIGTEISHEREDAEHGASYSGGSTQHVGTCSAGKCAEKVAAPVEPEPEAGEGGGHSAPYSGGSTQQVGICSADRCTEKVKSPLPSPYPANTYGYSSPPPVLLERSRLAAEASAR